MTISDATIGWSRESRLGEELLRSPVRERGRSLPARVVISQVAVETVAEVGSTVLFGINVPRSRETMMKVLPDRSFQREGTRRLWQDLTGDRISKSPPYGLRPTGAPLA